MKGQFDLSADKYDAFDFRAKWPEDTTGYIIPPTSLYGHSAVIYKDTTLYVFGGISIDLDGTLGWSHASTLWKLPITVEEDIGKDICPFLSPIRGDSALLFPDFLLYVFFSLISPILICLLAANVEFTTVALKGEADAEDEVPSGRYFHAAGLYFQDVYMYGGYPANSTEGPLNDFWVFNLGKLG